MNKPILSGIAAFLLITTGTAFAGGDAGAGKQKAAVCGACHGMDGNSVNPEWPNLAGQGTGYIIKQLQDFKGGKRQNAVMAPQAANLSEQDMMDLAAYYSTQKPKPAKADSTKVALGEALYLGGNSSTGVAACSGCHGPGGQGNAPAKFPNLSGQHAKYSSIQLKAFRTSGRSNDAGKMMRGVAERLSDAEIDAVSSYIMGLH